MREKKTNAIEVIELHANVFDNKGHLSGISLIYQ